MLRKTGRRLLDALDLLDLFSFLACVGIAGVVLFWLHPLIAIGAFLLVGVAIGVVARRRQGFLATVAGAFLATLGLAALAWWIFFCGCY